jgi:hypothetical protein
MSYHGINKLIQYSNRINVNVSQSSDKVKSITTFKTINVKAVFDEDYDINSNSSFDTTRKTINVKNALTSPDSGYVNLFFTTMNVSSSAGTSYNQSNKNVLAKKMINVKYQNTNSYSSNDPSRLQTISKTMIVDTNNSNQILTIPYNNDQVIASFHKNPATVAQNINFSDNDLWS